MRNENRQQFETRISSWAESQPVIRAILVVGSSARRDHPADEWSDLDLQVFVTDFSEYLSDTDWLEGIGTMWVCVPYQRSDGEPEQLVVFDGGQKLDFHFLLIDDLHQMVQNQTLHGVYRRGYTILVDKDSLAAQLPPCPFAPTPVPKPSADDFQRSVNLFWYGALQLAKTIRRRDLWVLKMGDALWKGCLLEMMEWHARATHDWEYDTWYGGRFIEEWTDLQTRNALPGLFAFYDVTDSWRALLTTMELYRRLATETAQILGYIYPALLDERVTQTVRKLFVEDSE